MLTREVPPDCPIPNRYSRRLRRIEPARLGHLRFFFADGWLPLLTYCGAIAAFGSIKLLSDQLDLSSAKTWLVTLLVTSTALHPGRIGGALVGVGDWRPKFGRFKVELRD